MRFNVKSKDNYDKEYGTNQVYQFVFGREHLEQMLAENAERKARTLGNAKTPKPKNNQQGKNKAAQDWDVEYPNQIYVTIRGRKNCALDVAVQLTLQPELIDEATLKLQQMQKQKELVDHEQLAKIEKELGAFANENQAFLKKALGINDLNFVKENVKHVEQSQSAFQKQIELRLQGQRRDNRQLHCQRTKKQLDLEYR